MQTQEFTGKTVDEAIRRALESLGKKPEELNISVLSLGRSGMLGLGVEEARIRVSPKPPDIGQQARLVLETLLGKMNFPAKIELLTSETPRGRLTLNITDTDAPRLIGQRGQTLRALELLVNLILSHQLKRWVRVTIDVEGYRQQRFRSLRNLALRLAEQVKSTGKPITTEPLPADERRIIHLTLNKDREVVAKTIGEGDERKIVIEKLTFKEQPTSVG